MPKPTWTLLAGVSLAGAFAAAAHAETPEPASPSRAVETLAIDGGSARGVAQSWMILPHGAELGAELKLITSDPSLGGGAIKFSDVGILTLRGRKSLAGKAELVGSVDLLPKQPSYTDEMVFQGGGLGLRFQIPDHAIAVSLRGAGGPMISDLGWWGAVGANVEARKRLAKIMTFQGALAGTGTFLRPDAPASDGAWVAEASASGSVLFRDPWGTVGGWLGVGYAVPLAQHGADPMSGDELDPQPRLDLHVGCVVSLVEEWDVFVDLAVVDRGEMETMATRLPILDGGFDQKQLILGVTYHPPKERGEYVMVQD
jgi:hypothetical protein